MGLLCIEAVLTELNDCMVGRLVDWGSTALSAQTGMKECKSLLKMCGGLYVVYID